MSMLEPAIEDMAEKVGNKYKLTSLISKRAKQIQKRNIREEISPEVKEISEALNELATDRLVEDKD